MENNTFIAKEQVNDFVSRLQDCLYELSIKLERANYMILNVEHEYFCDAVSCHEKNHGMPNTKQKEMDNVKIAF